MLQSDYRTFQANISVCAWRVDDADDAKSTGLLRGYDAIRNGRYRWDVGPGQRSSVQLPDSFPP